jgi:hypothetical protein
MVVSDNMEVTRFLLLNKDNKLFTRFWLELMKKLGMKKRMRTTTESKLKVWQDKEGQRDCHHQSMMTRVCVIVISPIVVFTQKWRYLMIMDGNHSQLNGH